MVVPVNSSAPLWKEVYVDPLTSVGWFVPPFTTMGMIGTMAGAIRKANGAYSQDDLERDLEAMYGPIHLAAMVVQRYPQARVIGAYAETIAEAAEAHLLGLHHVAVAGLMPVVEGAARQLAAERSIYVEAIRGVFAALTEACKEQVIAQQLGSVAEVLGMLDSFAAFTTGYLYERSDRYPLADKTNRHGIGHGAYADADYGRPLNFFKTIAAIDFLTFVSTFTGGGGSWFAPTPTPRALFLAQDWLSRREARNVWRNEGMPANHALALQELRKARSWLEQLPRDEPIPMKR